MRVHEDRALCAGSFPFAVNGWWLSGFEPSSSRGFKPRCFHHLDDERGVPADVLRVGGDVRDREQPRELF